MNEDTLRTLRLLIAELAAIELWDAQLWLDGSPYRYEIVAFVLRRCRRREIITNVAAILAPGGIGAVVFGVSQEDITAYNKKHGTEEFKR